MSQAATPQQDKSQQTGKTEASQRSRPLDVSPRFPLTSLRRSNKRPIAHSSMLKGSSRAPRSQAPR